MSDNLNLREKLRMLKDAGFYSVPEKGVFYHPDLRVCFSLEFLEDHTAEEIRERIRPHDEVSFEFNRKLDSEAVEEWKRVLVTAFGEAA